MPSPFGPTVVQAGIDDAVEAVGGTINRTGNPNLSLRSTTNAWVGLWWATGIPQGATILTAILKLNFTLISSGHTVDCYCEKVAAPATFTGTASEMTNATKTTAKVTITLPSATGLFTSPDLSTIVQEAINVASASGGMKFLFDTTGQTANITFNSQESGSGATLTITYSGGVATPIWRRTLTTTPGKRPGPRLVGSL